MSPPRFESTACVRAFQPASGLWGTSAEIFYLWVAREDDVAKRGDVTRARGVAKRRAVAKDQVASGGTIQVDDVRTMEMLKPSKLTWLNG